MFAVPSSLYGHPRYDADAAAEYLSEELASRGYAVTLHGAGVMAICWASAGDGTGGASPMTSRDVYDIAM